MTIAMSAPAAAPATAARRTVALWLLACCAMVFVMVVLGGLTRLTESGLSMVEWQPLHILPPMTEADWQDTFAKYQQSPEYRHRNAGMTVEGFKGIFWLEYIHRLWGRAIGVVFLLPLGWFAARRMIDRAMAWKLGGLLALGGLQGLMGWIMVASGLIDRPAVSQYKLALHLGLAVLIYGAMLWMALGLLVPHRRPPQGVAAVLARRLGWVAGLIFATLVSGAFVANLQAGMGFNTFPLMNGRFVPDGVMAMSPWYVNFFENVATVQFQHRLLAETTVGLALFAWYGGRRADISPRARLALDGFAAMALIQLGLGIGTLLSMVPIPLAATHQAGALVLVTLALWARHEVRA